GPGLPGPLARLGALRDASLGKCRLGRRRAVPPAGCPLGGAGRPTGRRVRRRRCLSRLPRLRRLVSTAPEPPATGAVRRRRRGPRLRRAAAGGDRGAGRASPVLAHPAVPLVPVELAGATGRSSRPLAAWRSGV